MGHPTQMVGVFRRWIHNNGKYKLGHEQPNWHIPLAIGRVMMFSVKYLAIYMGHAALTSFSNEQPCEDIAMNALIYALSGKKTIIVKGSFTDYPNQSIAGMHNRPHWYSN